MGWGLCGRLCPVLVCRGRYGLGGGSSLHSGIEFGRSRTGKGSSGGRKKGVEEGSLQGRLESEPVSSTDRDRDTRVRG